MVCKYCGCENLEGSTRCIYCGEPLSASDANIGNIMSAFAGVSVDESAAENNPPEKHSGLTVVSAVRRLRRTDVSGQEAVSAEEEERLRLEALALAEAGEAEQIELNWAENPEAAEEPADLPAQGPADEEEESFSHAASEEEAARLLSAQAAEIVSRAVEKIVGKKAPDPAETEAAAPAEESAQQETPETEAVQEEKPEEEPVKPRRIPEQPESPFHFDLEEIPEKETEEAAVSHNFVQAAAAAVPAVAAAAFKGNREEAEDTQDTLPDDTVPEETERPEEKDGIDFIPNIALTGTSQIMKETREEEEQARKEAERRSAYAAAEEKRNRAAKRRRTHWIWILLFLLALAGIAYLIWIRPMQQYNRAVELMQKGNYREALTLFEQSGDYKDSRQLADECLSHLGVDPTPASSAEVPGTDASPSQTLPPESTPESQPQPSESSPAESTAEPTLPIMTDPFESTPEESTPEESTPEESTPEESTPEESTPEETTPEETTPEAGPQVKAGDIVRFGHYEQDNNSGNGKEEIEWIVLEAEEDRVLLISRYILDTARYRNPSAWTTYEYSDIRSWLNHDFYNTAFSAQEREGLLTYGVDPGVNPHHTGTNQGPVVYDKVGLLSVEQILKYFTGTSDRQCTATEYCVTQRKVHKADNGFSPWWTTTMGQNNESACLARSDGAINYNGRELTVWIFGVRPVICISPSALN